MPQLLALAQGDAKLHIAPSTGGAIACFEWRGAPVLRPTSPETIAAGEVRRHACYPLVPYSNRIEHGQLAFGGRTYPIALNFGDHPHAIHGVGWQRPWTVQDLGSSSALLACDYRPARDADATASPWPWPFRATQWFQLCDTPEGGALLRMRLTLINSGSTAFPFGLGWHPFFPANAHTTLAFSATGVWETDPTIIPTRHVDLSAQYDFRVARAITSAVLDHVYTGWSGEATLRQPDAHRVTIMRGDTASRWFVCYIPPHHTFLAIEPVTQMTNAFNRASRGERDTGTRLLAPGESFSVTMEIEARADKPEGPPRGRIPERAARR